MMILTILVVEENIHLICMYITSLPPIRETKDNHKMRRIKRIEPILCCITMYESSCSII